MPASPPNNFGALRGLIIQHPGPNWSRRVETEDVQHPLGAPERLHSLIHTPVPFMT